MVCVTSKFEPEKVVVTPLYFFFPTRKPTHHSSLTRVAIIGPWLISGRRKLGLW